MKKNILFFNLVLSVLILTGDVFYILYDELWIKSITSIGFVLIALINFIYLLKVNKNNLVFAMFMLIGLIFAMFGDILLEIEFVIGAILFAVGHIFYFVAYTRLVKFNWKDLIFGVCIFVPATILILVAPIFEFEILPP